MAKVVGRCQGLGGVAKDVGARPRLWVRGQGRVGVAKAVEAWLWPWGHGQGRVGVAKAMGVVAKAV